ncbi:MAG: putative YigZ family protein [Desulforhopalus sp.]|jgi:uncharacterized YigZ family protein
MSFLYYTPVNTVAHTTVEKKSRFITFVSEVSSKEQALEQLGAIASREVGANHNCSAYIIGNPSCPKAIHCSDDGEPSGTAGKPLLNILLHENIGNVLVVVTRYFGGIKLGSGGLVRAYSNGIKMALGEVELKGFVAKKKMNISFHYQFEGVIRRICEDRGAVILDTRYEVEPCFYLDVEEALLESFIAELQEITSGRVQVSLDKVV